MPSEVLHTNALARETSPYLLQHAHNPVDWHAWGPEAFELSRSSGKPIFLSVGYSTCYWCHVMERQCFENADIARLMNELFVNIKVDREERPDVDELYMTAVQMMTGRGGWPMSVFLTPPSDRATGTETEESGGWGLKPFYAGTYFPPEPQHGMPSFPQILQAVARAWHDRRAQVREQAEAIATAMREHLARPTESGAAAVPNSQSIQRAANAFARTYDPEHGGFGGGPGASGPKFPQASVLLFLLKVHQNNPNTDLANALAHTLQRMARGGIFDQIGGGFHRYSTDPQWLVPHFEKMLYDNAQLIETYLAAEHIAQPAGTPGPPGVPGDPDFYRRVVRQTCDYVLREMTPAPGSVPAPSVPTPAFVADAASGDAWRFRDPPAARDRQPTAFWSAQDAEVDGREGANYLWTAEEVSQAILDPKLRELALAMYGLEGRPNFRDPHDPGARPANVLYLPMALDDLAAQRNVTLGDLLQAKSEIDQRLLAIRQGRKQPRSDDKVLTSWNGLMIGALAQAGQALGELRYTNAAAQAATFILTNMRQPPPPGSGPVSARGIFRTMRMGQAKVPGFLEDYAFLIHGLIELHRATNERSWLDHAADLAAVVERDFAAAPPGGGGESGGYFDTLADQTDLLVRTRSFHDGAIPSGNSQMVHDLIDLFELTGRDEYFDRAVAALKSSAALLDKQGQAVPHLEHALLRVLEIYPGCFNDSSVPVTAGVSKRAAIEPPVQAHLDSECMALKDGLATIRVVLSVGLGYHINAPGLEEAGASAKSPLHPTTLTLVGAPGWDLHVVYPPGQKRTLAMADQPLSIYERRVEIPVQIRATAALPPNAQPVLTVRYQACTDRECLPSAEIELPLNIALPPA